MGYSFIAKQMGKNGISKSVWKLLTVFLSKYNPKEDNI